MNTCRYRNLRIKHTEAKHWSNWGAIELKFWFQNTWDHVSYNLIIIYSNCQGIISNFGINDFLNSFCLSCLFSDEYVIYGIDRVPCVICAGCREEHCNVTRCNKSLLTTLWCWLEIPVWRPKLNRLIKWDHYFESYQYLYLLFSTTTV